jgi:hypothetical protein
MTDFPDSLISNTLQTTTSMLSLRTWETESGSSDYPYEWEDGVIFEKTPDAIDETWKAPEVDPFYDRDGLMEWALELGVEDEVADFLDMSEGVRNIDVVRALKLNDEDFMPTGRLADLAREHGADRVFGVTSHQERGTYSRTSGYGFVDDDDDIGDFTHIMVVPADVPNPAEFAELLRNDYDKWHTSTSYNIVIETATFDSDTQEWYRTSPQIIGGFVGSEAAEEVIQGGTY